ncbi:MAG: SLBB domain-containing protein [Candidatus Latescibacterota bacterium]
MVCALLRVLAALTLSVPLWAQETQEEPAGVEAPVPGARALGVTPIGMEAYREVMASGKYLVGPGDEFLIYLPGMDGPYTTAVLAEGCVFVPRGVGPVRVAGMQLRQARAEVESAYARAVKYGHVTFELSKPRSFPVPVLGAVVDAGAKAATAVERVGDVAARGGFVREGSSRRNIRVIKTRDLSPQWRDRVREMVARGEIGVLDSVASQRVDLTMFGVTGDSRYNPFVEDGDAIIVPPVQGQLGAMGALQRPAFYEYVPGDRLTDLLAMALGPAPGYDPDRVQLFRYAEDMVSRRTIQVDMVRALAGDPQADLLLEADDWLNVRRISRYHQRSEVDVAGEVVYPGYYVVAPTGTPLRDVLAMAGGFTDDASLLSARVVRQRVVDEVSKDPELDRIATVPAADRTEDDGQYFIMKSREKPGQMVVDFISLVEGDEGQNILLLPGDQVMIPRRQSTVIVSGQAARPGAVVFDSAYSVRDYIQQAGGLAWRASRDIRVIRAHTGEMKRAEDVTRLQPGDRIWIKEKPTRDYWALFTEFMQVVGQVSTVVLLYATLTR